MLKQLLIRWCVPAAGVWMMCATAGCSSSRKLSGAVACSNASSTGNSSRVAWLHAPKVDTSFVFPFPLPSKYGLYEIAAAELNGFFAFFKGRASDSAQVRESVISIPLPAPAGCQAFRVRHSDVLSPALQQKYPELVALRGVSAEGGHDLRLEYDGVKMKGQVLWQGQVYLVEPLQPARTGDNYLYMIYAKEDAGIRKRMFEQQEQAPPEQKSAEQKSNY